MGYLKDKYDRAYFLKTKLAEKGTCYGVEGLDEFQIGGIRLQDFDLLKRINFSNKTVIDLGFGRGEAIKYAIQKGARKVVGVDFSADANSIATDFLEKYGLCAELYCVDAKDFFKTYSAQENSTRFDIVLMFDFIEHVPREDLGEILLTLKQWINPNAILIVNTPIFRVDEDVIANGGKPKYNDSSDEVNETAGMHCNRFTKNSLKLYMNRFDFEAISGHFFCGKLGLPHWLQGTICSRIYAFRKGCPFYLGTLFQREKFEYAYTFDELQKNNERKLVLRKMRWYLANPQSIIKGIFRRVINRFLVAISHSKNREMIKKVDAEQTAWISIASGPLAGRDMLLHPDSHALWNQEMKKGTYDSFIYSITQSLGSMDGGTVWDVGAHIGYHTLAFAQCVGAAGKVVAFEPNPYNMRRIKSQLEKNKDLSRRIILMPLAVSNTDGVEELILSPDIDGGKSSGSHLESVITPETQEAYRSFVKTQVEVCTADTLISSYKLSEPTIIKLDVEGAEAKVLEGAQYLLTHARPIILIEVHHISAMHECMQILLKNKYQVSIIKDAPITISRCFVVAKPT